MDEGQLREQDIKSALGMAVASKATKAKVLLAAGDPIVVALAPNGKRQKGLRNVLCSEEWIGVDYLAANGQDVLDRYRRNVEVVEAVEDKPILEDPGTPPLAKDNPQAQLVAAMVHAQRAVLAPFVGMVETVVKGYGTLLETLQRKADGSEEREAQRFEMERAQLEADRAQLEADRAEIERQAADDESLSGALAPVVAALPQLLAGRGPGTPTPPAAAEGGG